LQASIEHVPSLAKFYQYALFKLIEKTLFVYLYIFVIDRLSSECISLIPNSGLLIPLYKDEKRAW